MTLSIGSERLEHLRGSHDVAMAMVNGFSPNANASHYAPDSRLRGGVELALRYTLTLHDVPMYFKDVSMGHTVSRMTMATTRGIVYCPPADSSNPLTGFYEALG